MRIVIVGLPLEVSPVYSTIFTSSNCAIRRGWPEEIADGSNAFLVQCTNDKIYARSVGIQVVFREHGFRVDEPISGRLFPEHPKTYVDDRGDGSIMFQLWQ